MEEIRMSLFVIVLTTICGSLLAIGYTSFQKAIEEKEKSLRMDILRAFNVPFTENTFSSAFNESVKIQVKNKTTYFFYNGEPKQVALITSGSGLWSVIEMYMLINLDNWTMRELKVLAHGETPGLGGRIEEAWFQDQFKGLDVSAGVKVEKEKKGVAGEVDAIAGATRTGNAVMTIINKAIDVLR
jgi:Na+-transporting NADH:ubiquinone oxidoreductase subunit C